VDLVRELTFEDLDALGALFSPAPDPDNAAHDSLQLALTMITDWDLIRDVLAAAVDACEAAEELGLTELDRSRPTGGDGVSVFDVWVSAWTYPENLELEVLRARHDLGEDVPYVPEVARVLRHVGELCGSLVGATRLDALPDEQHPSIRDSVTGLSNWYRETMTARLRVAAKVDEE